MFIIISVIVIVIRRTAWGAPRPLARPALPERAREAK